MSIVFDQILMSRSMHQDDVPDLGQQVPVWMEISEGTYQCYRQHGFYESGLDDLADLTLEYTLFSVFKREGLSKFYTIDTPKVCNKLNEAAGTYDVDVMYIKRSNLANVECSSVQQTLSTDESELKQEITIQFEIGAKVRRLFDKYGLAGCVLLELAHMNLDYNLFREFNKPGLSRQYGCRRDCNIDNDTGLATVYFDRRPQRKM